MKWIVVVLFCTGCSLGPTCFDRCKDFEDQLKEIGGSRARCDQGDADACAIADDPCAHYQDDIREITDCEQCVDFFVDNEQVELSCE
jgi:hypothetical protein